MTDPSASGDLAAWLRGLNTLDIILLAWLLLYALNGLRRGFIAGVLGLAGMAVAVIAAFQTYRWAGALIVQYFPLPVPLANVAGFIAALLVAQIGIAIVIWLVLNLLRPVRAALGPLNVVDHVLGIVPGLAQGLIFAALILVPLRQFPIFPPLTQGIEQSTVAKAIAAQAEALAPRWGEAFGHLLDESLLLQSRVVAPEEEIRITPRANVRPDPEAEDAMLELLNGERTRAGLRPLVADEALRQVARQHSEEMFQLGYFSHTSPRLGSPSDRIGRLGVRFATAGENLAYAPGVDLAHAGLMNSPSHRHNILDPSFSRIGIGVVSAGIHGRMFTQNFAG